MRLSVCCATSEPGPRVAALLGTIRDVADEIVLAVDSRLDASHLGHYTGVADRLFRFDYAPPIERAWAWLHAQCRGQWILKLDGDELPSMEMKTLLPKLVDTTDVLQYSFRCRWLFPDRDHWLDQPPWNYDGNRLVRNDPASLWLSGLIHTAADPMLPTRYLEAGYYHLSHLLLSHDERRAKIASYTGVDQQLKWPGVDADMEAMYLPEDQPRVDPVPVPEEDRAIIAAVLDASGPEVPTPPDVAVPYATRAVIDRYWPARPLNEAAYGALIEVVEPDCRLVVGRHRPVLVRVRNDGSEVWPGLRRHPLLLVSYRWLAGDGSVLVSNGFRTEFPASVPPGEATIVPVLVGPPDQAGTYILEFDIVYEHVRWFGTPTRTVVEVINP